MSKAKAFLGIITVLLIGLVLISKPNLMSLSPSKEKKMMVSVVLLDESQSEDKKFHNVFKQERPFAYDEKTKKYKLCVGEISPMTESTSCRVQSKIVEVLHQISQTAKSKTFFLCIYVNTEMTDCRIGDQVSEFYSSQELMGK